jgi:hypothetical protein
MAHLKEKGTVSEGGTPLDALGTTNTESLINIVFVVWLFDEGSFDRPGRAKLIFGAGVKDSSSQLEITGAEIAISAYSIKLNTFNSRIFQYTKSCASIASYALIRIDLPNQIIFPVLAGRSTGYDSESGQASSP